MVDSGLTGCRLQRLRSEREHQQFPDEVDTPTDCLTKTRFQKQANNFHLLPSAYIADS